MIKAANLSKKYFQGKTKIEAVKNVRMEVARKESILISGPSGAGKSTLLHLLGGLDRPSSGKLIFDGTDFYRLSDRARSRIRNEKVGFVFQFYHLLPEFNVLQNVMLPGIMCRGKARQNAKDIRRRAKKLLDWVGLSHRIKHTPQELSGGESQRTAIARALINSPEVLLCDEPTGNLDSKIGKDIIDCIWMLKEKEGMALVIVTHDERLKVDFDKKYRMQDGVLEEMPKNENISEWQVCR